MKGCFIEGEKIYLRPFNESDIEIWYQWFNNEEVTYHMDKRRFPNTPEKQLKFMKGINASPSDIQLAIVHKKDDELIGTVGLHLIDFINRNADISIVIGEKKYWKKGIGKEACNLVIDHAFNMLNLHKLTAGMVEENMASYNLFVSLGFEKEGVYKEQVFLHGKYRNIVKLGLPKGNYLATEAQRHMVE
ncbi:MAG: GNAT family protein [bacterium]